MSADDLVQWFRWQLDEDAARANAAAEELGGRYGRVWRYNGHSVETAAERDMVAIGSQDHMEPACGMYIADWDPARVLRDAEADRQLITAYVDAQSTVDALAHPDMYDVGRAQGLEEAVRHRALRFEGRAGYREEWSPWPGSDAPC